MFMSDEILYRIGDFADKLGVTPDMLKYCEKKGIITSVKSENGYRYYDFRQSAQVIEYMKLQNQGFSAEEIYQALHGESLSELVKLEKKHHDVLEKKLLFYKAMIDRNRQTEQLRNTFCTPPKWTMKQRSPAWFLQNSSGLSLVEEKAISERVRAWNEYLPIVESACCFGFFDRFPPDWGLYIDAPYAEQFGLDTSEPVIYLPKALVLEVYITRELGAPQRIIGEIGTTLPAKLGLRQTGNAYHRVITKMWNGNCRREYSILNIPVDYIE